MCDFENHFKERLPEVISLLELCNAIEQLLDQKKATDIRRISLKDHALMGDYFIVASGNSERQLAAVADALREQFKSQGKIILSGLGSNWVIVDLGSVIVHLLLPQARDLYNLEELWQAHQKSLALENHSSE